MPFLFAILEFTLRNVMLRDEITTNLQTLVLLLLLLLDDGRADLN